MTGRADGPEEESIPNRPRTIEDVRAGKREQSLDVDPSTPGQGRGEPPTLGLNPSPAQRPRGRSPRPDPIGNGSGHQSATRDGPVVAPQVFLQASPTG